MSSYLNFYLKDTSGNYNCLNSFSRNSAIYEYGSDFAVYGEGIALTQDTCAFILDSIDSELSLRDQAIKNCNERKELIAKMNNSMDEKLAAIEEVDNSIELINEITAELAAARGFYDTMSGILETATWSSRYNADNYIFFGIEWCPDYEVEV